MRVAALLSLLVACGGAPAVDDAGRDASASLDTGASLDAAPSADAEADASEPLDATVLDAAPAPACWRREVESDAGCACVASDPLCPVRGYAFFPMPNLASSGLPRPSSYVVDADLVHDVVTGLVWERSGDAGLVGWEEARARCDTLVLGGRDDFRLPSRIEWVSVLDPTRSPAIADAFVGVAPDYHWTSSPAFDRSAYTVYLGAAETAFARADPGSARVRCVAGPIGLHGLSVEGDRVFDRGTGLRWERALAAPMPHAEASARCVSLGMRLPSLRELQTIVDETRAMPAADLALFPDTPPDALWTSSLRGAEPWVVDFRDGQTFADRSASSEVASRCVL